MPYCLFLRFCFCIPRSWDCVSWCTFILMKKSVFFVRYRPFLKWETSEKTIRSATSTVTRGLYLVPERTQLIGGYLLGASLGMLTAGREGRGGDQSLFDGWHAGAFFSFSRSFFVRQIELRCRSLLTRLPFSDFLRHFVFFCDWHAVDCQMAKQNAHVY